MRNKTVLLLLLVICSVSFACGDRGGENRAPVSTSQSSPSPSPAASGTAASPAPNGKQGAEGQALYTQSCAMCHGPNGDPGSPNGMRAANLADKQEQARWTDDYIKEVISKGHGRMGPVSGLSGDEADKVVKYVRTFAK